MEIEVTCPLGHTCEKAVEGKIERCAWYTNIAGVNPQDGKEMSTWKCAIAWQPILLIEVAGQARAGNASIQSLRNNMDGRQKQALEVISGLQVPSNS